MQEETRTTKHIQKPTRQHEDKLVLNKCEAT